MNTLKNIDPDRKLRKAARRAKTKRIPRRDITPLVSARKVKPARRTIITQGTAARLLYLQGRRLADFSKSDLIVETNYYRDSTGRKCKLPKGTQRVGV